jgi:adenylate cyclase
MCPDASAANAPEPAPKANVEPIQGQILETYEWAVQAGLRAVVSSDLFAGFCQRLLAAGLPLWRAYAATATLHPQMNGYGYTWRRDLSGVQPEQYGQHGENVSRWLESPLYDLIRRRREGEDVTRLRRRLEQGPEQRDFPALREYFAAGATDYVARLFPFGRDGDRSRGSGIVYSFIADSEGGFSDEQAALLDATLPALSLAMKADVGHVIASGLLETYLGHDAGRRVHEGAIERGSATRLKAVLWYADIRGFTGITDATPGPIVIDMLNEVFEALTATLRARGGQVLKFIGDAMLATFSLEEGDPAPTCRRALDAALEATQRLDASNATRAAAGLPVAMVDLALHLGEVFYGNVGAVDRLDFTVIGPAVNEVARIEALCEPLGRQVLVSADFVAAAQDFGGRLQSLGRHCLRGVGEPKEIFALTL